MIEIGSVVPKIFFVEFGDIFLLLFTTYVCKKNHMQPEG